MKQWYAVHCKPKKENVVVHQLDLREVEVYYPCIKVMKNNSGSHIIKPFFPGYIFIRIRSEHASWSRLKWIPFTFGIVGYGGEPAPIPDHFIEFLRTKLESINRGYKKPLVRFKEGNEVVIKDGIFKGHDAIFKSCKSSGERVNVLLRLIENEFVQVELPARHIHFKEHISVSY
jgi:transcriptional antiterminator RfaH